MASYTPPSLSGYNATPPPDDGSETGANEVSWAKHIDKIGDPLKNFSEAIDTATTTAFTTIDAQLLTDSNKYAVDSGAADAYVVTLSPAITAYSAGHTFRFKATNTNTGASTINVNGLGAKDIKTKGIADPAAGTILANGVYQLTYDGTQYQIEVASNHTFVNLGTGEPAVSTTLLQFTQATLTIDIWEGVGPTASGETNIWTALDGVPSDVDWIEVYAILSCTDTGGNNVGASGHVREDGSSAGIDFTTEVIRSQATGDTTGDQAVVATSNSFKIPVSSRVFDITYTDKMFVGTPDSIIFDLRLTGYGYN